MHEHVAEVDAVEVVPLLVGLLVERLARPAVVPDVVDEYVDAPELVARGGHQCVGDLGLPHVGHDRGRASARAGDRDLRFTGARFVDLRDHDRRGFGREPLRDTASDAATSTGDDRDLAREHFTHGQGR